MGYRPARAHQCPGHVPVPDAAMGQRWVLLPLRRGGHSRGEGIAMSTKSNTWAARAAGLALATILGISALPASALASASAPATSARYGVKLQHPGASVRQA